MRTIILKLAQDQPLPATRLGMNPSEADTVYIQRSRLKQGRSAYQVIGEPVQENSIE